MGERRWLGSARTTPTCRAPRSEAYARIGDRGGCHAAITSVSDGRVAAELAERITDMTGAHLRTR
jgi:hypothetical protein